jgi:hypothetical protein
LKENVTMKKKYAAELAKAKTYRCTLFTMNGDALAGITVNTPAFLMLLRRYNDGHPNAFTEYVLRELRMRPEQAHLYYVVIQAETEAWMPLRGGENDMAKGGCQANP